MDEGEIYPEDQVDWASMTGTQREIFRAVVDACTDAQFAALLGDDVGDDVLIAAIAEGVVQTLSADAVDWCAQLHVQTMAATHFAELRRIGPPSDPS
jgi:hypothetical protein